MPKIVFEVSDELLGELEDIAKSSNTTVDFIALKSTIFYKTCLEQGKENIIRDNHQHPS